MGPAGPPGPAGADGGSARRSAFFPANGITTIGPYRTLRIWSSSSAAFAFDAPLDLDTLVAVHVVCIPSSGAAGPGRDIDFVAHCATLGEDTDEHAEQDGSSTYDLSGTAGRVHAIDVTALFDGMTAGSLCGLQLEHDQIGGSIDYLGIRVVYDTE